MPTLTGFWNDNSRRRRIIHPINHNNTNINNEYNNYGGKHEKIPSSRSSSKRIFERDFYMVLKIILLFVAIIYFVVLIRHRILSSSSTLSLSSWLSTTPVEISRKQYCDFRKYPTIRYYGLNKNNPLPDFLINTEYIYGELPYMIKLETAQKQRQYQKKLCVDQAEWYPGDYKENTATEETASTATKESIRKGIQAQTTQSNHRLPFADGTNPSILKLIDNPRIDSSIRLLFSSSSSSSSYGESNNNGDDDEKVPHYLLTICMTDSQCSWGASLEERAEYNLAIQKQPSTVRTVLLILNQRFETIGEATIKTKIDALFGGRRNQRPVKPNNQYQIFAHDDARLFTHDGQIWVSYREGKLFGYEKQVLNRLHFDFGDATSSSSKTTITTGAAEFTSSGLDFKVTLLASETETLCCGRNMALIDNVKTNQLQALTWVDPVTVVDVDMKKKINDGERNKLDGVNQTHRRLEQKKKKKKKESHFHGTNGFMVHLAERNEYLGIGHFHRPPDRKKNDYAKFGHHYTHAFFTISDTSPFHLKRLSSELVLPSHAHPNDAEVIQFWSGLERIDQSTLAIAYGINDCEGAAMYLDLAIVENLLRDVPKGKEVVDLMMPLKDVQ